MDESISSLLLGGHFSFQSLIKKIQNVWKRKKLHSVMVLFLEWELMDYITHRHGVQWMKAFLHSVQFVLFL